MDIDTAVLRAILRLSRRREAADEEALAVRAAASPVKVRAAVRRLEAAGLVYSSPHHAPRLSLEGLAVAVAMLPLHGRARQAPRTRAPRAA